VVCAELYPMHRLAEALRARRKPASEEAEHILAAARAEPAEAPLGPSWRWFRAGNPIPRCRQPLCPEIWLTTVDTRTELSETGVVKGAEFERRVRKLARSRKVTCRFVADKGKGSHGRLYLGDEFTTLKDRKKEIGRDLLAKMCADLKIDPHDL
jgi:mRNA interferase HicA